MALEGVQVHLVECVDDAAALMRWLGETRYESVLGFDTETEGLHYWRQNCRLAQFGDARTAYVVPFSRWGGVVEEVFRRYEGPIVGHNLRFDARFMAHHGIDIGLHRCHDTMLAANALWPDQKLALKTLAQHRIDPHAADGQRALDEAMSNGGWNWSTVPVDCPQYWGYAGLDAILSAQLFEQMYPMLSTEGVRDVYDLECAVSTVLFGMETRGARIDVPYCETKYDELTAYARNLRAWCLETFGVSPGSIDEVIRRLQSEGIEFTKRTKSGRLALDEDVLSAIDHPLAQTVLYVRKSEKVASSYFRNFVELADGDILHCSVKQVGAKTGRMSVTEPALQTLPKGNQVVRAAFIPSDNNKLVSIDYAQVEMRIFASYAGEEEMVRRIAHGIDLHTAVAQVIYNLTDVPDELRRLTKNANFAKVYGAGAVKFAQTAHITEEEGIAFFAQYDTTFPGVGKFQHEVIRKAKERLIKEGKCYVRAQSGRLHVSTERDAYKLVNYLIQGSAADVLKQKLVALDLAGFGEHMVLPIHDEVLFNFPADEAEMLTKQAAEIMVDRTSFRVPLEVSATAPMDRWEK